MTAVVVIAGVIAYFRADISADVNVQVGATAAGRTAGRGRPAAAGGTPARHDTPASLSFGNTAVTLPRWEIT